MSLCEICNNSNFELTECSKDEAQFEDIVNDKKEDCDSYEEVPVV